MIKMKYILVPAVLGVFFTACNNEPKGPSQEEMDKMVSDKVQMVTDQLKADCDTRFNDAVKMRADSMLAATPATKNVKAPVPVKAPAAHTTIKVPPTKTTTPPAHTTPTNVNDRVGGNGKTAEAPKNVNDRVGGNDTKKADAPKTVNDRVGGNK